jgi:hypothetical protein
MSSHGVRSLAALVGGRFAWVGGFVTGWSVVTTAGQVITLGGVLLYAYLLVAAFHAR